MKISLMRHAEPVAGERNDPTRGLTEDGRKQATEMGAFMAREFGAVEAIITSYFARALDTAKIMADALGCTNVHETPWLEPNAPAEKALAEINRLAGNKEHVLVVTHHPLIQTLLSDICGAKTDEVHFLHGAIAHLDGQMLRWFVDPHLVSSQDGKILSQLTEVAYTLAEIAEEISLTEDWVTIDGAHVFIDDSGVVTKGPSRLLGMSHKAAVARSSYSGGSKHEQDVAERMENHLADALGMKKSSNNKPFDLFGTKYAVEVKTLVSNTNDKITMNKAAIERKDAFVKTSGLKPFTVVVDARGATPKYFVREKYGSFRIGSMTEVPSPAGVRSFMRSAS